MAVILWANNAASTLAGPISASAIVVQLAAGTGALFPNPTTGQYFTLTFQDAATGLQNEIAYCTARSGDTLTIVRGQEGTTAQAWNTNDLASNFVTAGSLAQLLQQGQLPPNTIIYTGTDTGTANNLVATASPAPTAYTHGSCFIIQKSSSSNTGAMNGNISGLGVVPIVNADGTALSQGQYPASERGFLVYWQPLLSLILLNPVTTAATNGGLSFTPQQVGKLAIENLLAPTGAIAGPDKLAIYNQADAADRSITLTQLNTAIGSLLGQLIASSGYQILPGGLILQWVTGPTDPANATTGITHTVSWPVAFPNACLVAVISQSINGLGNVDVIYYIYGQSSTQVSFLRGIIPGGPTPAVTQNGIVFAVGY